MRAPYFGTDAVLCLADIPIVGWTLKISVIEGILASIEVSRNPYIYFHYLRKMSLSSSWISGHRSDCIIRILISVLFVVKFQPSRPTQTHEK